MNLLADISFSTEALAIIGGLGSGLVTAVIFLFKALMVAKEKQLADMTSSRESYKEMAAESIANIEVAVNRVRELNGEQKFKPLAPVVAEHRSPTGEVQKQQAELQTMRARLVAATLNLDIPPRPASRPATAAEEIMIAQAIALPSMKQDQLQTDYEPPKQS